MSQPSSFKDFQGFIKGEIRVDGWISPWRQDFNVYMNGRTVVHKAPSVAKPVRVHQPRVYRADWGVICPGCNGKMLAGNRMGICTPCQRKWRKYIERPVMHFCSTCNVPIRSSTKYELCEVHAKRLRAKLWAQKNAQKVKVAA